MMQDISAIFSLEEENFQEACLRIFEYQYHHNTIYRNFSQSLHRTPQYVHSLEDIPFLPISFFKTHKIVSGMWQPEMIFGSSGTTGMQQSKHYIKDVALYEKSFLEGFRYFYGEPRDYCFLALLPSYLERNDSSLIYMVQKLMEASGNRNNGFYLYNHQELKDKLIRLDVSGEKVFLWGVAYALLDFSRNEKMNLQNTIVLETGGMKGKRKELIKNELHELLQNRFGVKEIHSEYGMTELLSQAYSKGGGIFQTPPWMRVMIRETDDPLHLSIEGKTGGINIIDLANVHSCSFIATKDLGKKFHDGSFEISGRFDAGDIRGCNLMVD